MGKRRALRGDQEIHVVLTKQDLSLQVKMESHASAALTGRAAAFADPFPQQELPGIPIGWCHFISPSLVVNGRTPPLASCCLRPDANVQVSCQAAGGGAKNGNVYTQTGSGPALTILVEIRVEDLTVSR